MKYNLAKEKAKELHEGQIRKGEGIPFIQHPIEVVSILKKHNIDDDSILSAAILHDTVEDTSYTKEELIEDFGKIIASYVLDCTDNKSYLKYERKLLQAEEARYIQNESKLIKIADKIANMNSIVDFPPSNWDNDRIIGYTIWSNKVVANIIDSVLILYNANKIDFDYFKQISSLNNSYNEIKNYVFEKYRYNKDDEELLYYNYIQSLKNKH